jgi:hypothetical protein
MISAARELGRVGRAPGAGGLLLAAALLAARAFASATPERVYVFGYEAHWPCLFSRIFALPCPGCGLTRGSLLTLDGRWAEALALNPAAPLVVLGAALLAAALVSLSLLGRARRADAAARLSRRLRAGVRIYGAVLGAVLLVNWLAQLLARLA